MNILEIIKAGFIGFILAIGPMTLVFYIYGAFIGSLERRFHRIFVVGAIVSFGFMYFLLHYKISMQGQQVSPVYFSGVVGGWLGGLVACATNVKPLLEKMAKGRDD